MTPEDHLDDLLRRLQFDFPLPPRMSAEDASKLSAADAVSRLNDIEPPPALAARMEARVRAQARAHQNGHALRTVPIPLQSRLDELAPRPPTKPRRTPLRHVWIAALCTAAVLVLALLGVSNAAAGSLPGDPLYGVKHFEQQMALSNANSPAARANLQISQVQSALDDLQTEVSAGRSEDDTRQALAIVASDTRQSQDAVAALPAGTDRDTAEQSLAAVLHNEQTTLYALLARVDWSLRLAFTQQLGVLGAAVPIVTQVTATPGANNTVTVKVTGVNFEPGALLVVNGMVSGTVIQNSATSLTASIDQSNWNADKSAVGVMNPDGTAAQQRVGDDNGDDDSHATPGVTPTAGSNGGDDGDDGGSGGDK